MPIAISQIQNRHIQHTVTQNTAKKKSSHRRRQYQNNTKLKNISTINWLSKYRDL